MGRGLIEEQIMALLNKLIDLIYKVATGSWRTRLILVPIVGAFYLSIIASCVLLAFIVDQFFCASRKQVCYP